MWEQRVQELVERIKLQDANKLSSTTKRLFNRIQPVHTFQLFLDNFYITRNILIAIIDQEKKKRTKKKKWCSLENDILSDLCSHNHHLIFYLQPLLLLSLNPFSHLVTLHFALVFFFLCDANRVSTVDSCVNCVQGW